MTACVWRATLSMPPRLGGREIHVTELSREQGRQRPVLLMFAWGKPVPMPGVQIRRLRSPGPASPAVVHASVFAGRVAWDLYRAIRNGRAPDYLHLHGDIYETAVLSAFRRLVRSAPPVLVTLHATPTLNPLTRLLWRASRPRNMTYLAVSSAAAQRLRELLGPEVSIRVQSSAARTSFHNVVQDCSPSRLVSTGIVSPRRDFETIIKAVAESRTRPPLRVIGAGCDLARLVNLAGHLGVNLKIGPLTDPEDIAAELRGSVYVQARNTVEEGFPSAIMEAIAAGAPVLAPYFPAVSDYLGHDYRGYSSSADLARAIDQAFDKIIDTPTVAHRKRAPTWPDVAAVVDAAAVLSGALDTQDRL